MLTTSNKEFIILYNIDSVSAVSFKSRSATKKNRIMKFYRVIDMIGELHGSYMDHVKAKKEKSFLHSEKAHRR